MKYRDLVMRYRPIGYWPLDDAGRTTARDLAEKAFGTGADGSLGGTVNPTLGAASRFRGRRPANFAQGYVQIADTDGWSLTNDLTVVAWAFLQGENVAASTIVAKRNLNTGGEFEWIMRQLTSGDALNVQFTNTSSADLADASGGTVSTGRWYMVAFTSRPSSTTVLVYVNGVEVASDTTWSGSIRNSSSPLYIGWWGGGDTNQSVNGLIMDVALFDKILGPGVLRKFWATGRRSDR